MDMGTEPAILTYWTLKQLRSQWLCTGLPYSSDNMILLSGGSDACSTYIDPCLTTTPSYHNDNSHVKTNSRVCVANADQRWFYVSGTSI